MPSGGFPLGLATALAPTAHATGPTVSRGLALAPADVVVVTHDHRVLDAFDGIHEMNDGVLSERRSGAAHA